MDVIGRLQDGVRVNGPNGNDLEGRARMAETGWNKRWG